MAGAVIIGVGPGIGTAVARRFAAARMPLGLIARTAATLDAARAAVAASGVTVAGATADAGRDDQLTAALDR
jgi:short-subunit dehydrogenase